MRAAIVYPAGQAAPLEAHGANVTGELESKEPNAAAHVGEWLEALGSGT